MTDAPDLGVEIPGYRVESVLGAGGMGIVYLARGPQGGICALKVLPRRLLGDDPSFATRFKREAQYAEALDHPHVVELYEAGEAPDGTLYIAMQYVDGPDLGVLIRRDGAFSLPTALSILAQIGDALDSAHATGLVHRDVKPANIIVADDPGGPQAYLADFGLSKNRTQDSIALTKLGQLIGTMSYTAPEEIMSTEPRDHRVDIYSLGCVLFEAVVGKPPFVRERDIELLYAHVGNPRPSAIAARPDLPAGFDDVIAKAMAIAPDDRYSSCHELIAAVRALLPEEEEASGEPDAAASVPAPPSGISEPDQVATPVTPEPAEEVSEQPAALVLLVRSGLGHGLEIIIEDEVVLGRLVTLDGVLAPDHSISRRHARITRADDGGFVVEDEHSRNGTFLNDERIETPHALRPGDLLKIGSTIFLATAPEAPQAEGAEDSQAAWVEVPQAEGAEDSQAAWVEAPQAEGAEDSQAAWVEAPQGEGAEDSQAAWVEAPQAESSTDAPADWVEAPQAESGTEAPADWIEAPQAESATAPPAEWAEGSAVESGTDAPADSIETPQAEDPTDAPADAVETPQAESAEDAAAAWIEAPEAESGIHASAEWVEAPEAGITADGPADSVEIPQAESAEDAPADWIEAPQPEGAADATADLAEAPQAESETDAPADWIETPQAEAATDPADLAEAPQAESETDAPADWIEAPHAEAATDTPADLAEAPQAESETDAPADWIEAPHAESATDTPADLAEAPQAESETDAPAAWIETPHAEAATDTPADLAEAPQAESETDAPAAWIETPQAESATDAPPDLVEAAEDEGGTDEPVEWVEAPQAGSAADALEFPESGTDAPADWIEAPQAERAADAPADWVETPPSDPVETPYAEDATDTPADPVEAPLAESASDAPADRIEGAQVSEVVLEGREPGSRLALHLEYDLEAGELIVAIENGATVRLVRDGDEWYVESA